MVVPPRGDAARPASASPRSRRRTRPRDRCAHLARERGCPGSTSSGVIVSPVARRQRSRSRATATIMTMPNAPSTGASSAGTSTIFTSCPSDSSSRPASFTARTQSGATRSPSRRARAQADAQAPRRRADFLAERADRRRRGVRIARSGARDRVEHERGVADRACEHVFVRERTPVLTEVGPERGAGTRRLQADDAAHRCGESDRAAHVVAVRDRDHARTRPRPRLPPLEPPGERVRSHGLCVAP